MLQDLRYAWRSLRATPRLALTAIACAALGLAAAIFMTTLVRAVLFVTPSIPNADRLVRVWTASTTSAQTSDVSYPDVIDLRARVASFDAVESASRTRVAHTTDAGTERLRGESVTPGYFDLVGVRPAIGRLFATHEYAPGADRPVVIGHALWQRRYGGRADIVGQPFRTRPASRQAGESVRTIVGVMPPGFDGTVDPDVSEFWLPVAHYEPMTQLTNRLVRSTWAIARLRPGVSLETAVADVRSIGAALALEHPAAFDRSTLTAERFGESWRERFRLSLYTLLAAAGLLLLIACTNVATLLLARLAQRQGEMRVRLALGAPRLRIVRQLLLESLILAVAGGAAGLLLATAAIRTVAGAGLFALPPYVQIAVDTRTALSGLALVLITGLVFGVLPARIGSRSGAIAGDAATVRVSPGRHERRYGRVLVVAQVALTFLLLVAATLLFRTYQNLVGSDLGYRTTQLLRMAVSTDPGEFRDRAAQLELAAAIKRTFDAYPGVRQSAVMGGVLPPWFDDAVDIASSADARLRDVGRHAVGPDYFDVMGMSVRRGRIFEPADRAAGAVTAIASESLARRLAEATGRDAIGQRVRASVQGMAGDETLEIVGVVNDVVYHGPLRPRAADHDVYVPLERGDAGTLSIAVHTSVDPATLIEPLSRELGRLAPSSPQHWISTMEGEMALQYRDARLYASLSGVYGGAAAMLAVLGIYSVLAHQVARRRRELGVRIAIGARATDIVRLVLAEGLGSVALGIVIGLGLSLAASRLVAGLLYGVAPGDPFSITLVAAAMIAASVAAALVPSLRAARVDPLTALRTP